MGLFDGLPMMTEQEAMQKMELAQNTRASVKDILRSNGFGSKTKYVMCIVSNSMNTEKEWDIKIIVACSQDRDGYLDSYSGYKDIDGISWEYAYPINMDGTAMSVYDYERAR